MRQQQVGGARHDEALGALQIAIFRSDRLEIHARQIEN